MNSTQIIYMDKTLKTFSRTLRYYFGSQPICGNHSGGLGVGTDIDNMDKLCQSISLRIT